MVITTVSKTDDAGSNPAEDSKIMRKDMSAWLLSLIGVVYLAIAIDMYLNNRIGLSITHFGYAIGNLGLLIAVIWGK